MLMAGRIAMTAATRKRDLGNGLTDPCDSLRVSDFGTIAISRENLRNRLEWGECFKERQLESFRQKTRS